MHNPAMQDTPLIFIESLVLSIRKRESVNNLEITLFPQRALLTVEPHRHVQGCCIERGKDEKESHLYSVDPCHMADLHFLKYL